MSVPVALPDDPGSILSTHTVAHTHLSLQFSDTQCPLLAFTDLACMWCLEIPAGRHHVQLKNGFQGAGAMTHCIKPFPHSMRFRVQTPRTCVETRKYGNCLFFQHLGAGNKIPGVSWLARQAKLYERSRLSKQSGERLRL